MPASIRDAILARVQHFGADTRKVLEMSAVVGTRASFRVLEAISGLDASTVLGAVEELNRGGLLEERSEGSEIVYDFRHPLVRQTLYDEFGLQRARIMHGVVAEAMEEHYGDQAPEHADELAFHFARTDGGRLRAKAAQYLVTAGRHALERRADAEAIAYLEAALERAEGSGSDGVMEEVLPLLARAHTHVGNFDAAESLWETALERTSAEDPRRAGLRRAIGITNVWRGRHGDAARHFEEGLVEAKRSGDEAQVVRLLVAKAHGLHEVGKGREALVVLEEALPLATNLGDPGLLARVHRALALLYVWVGPPEKAVEHGERAIVFADEIGDLSVAFWARWGLAVLAGMRGDTVAMMRGVEEINALADEARAPVLRLWTADMAVEHAWGSGDWDAGIAKGEQAIALARSLNQRTLLPRLLVWTSQFYVARGNLEKAEELVREAVEMSGIDDPGRTHDVHQVVPTYIGLAHYLVHLGDYDDAIDAARKGLQIAEGTGYTLWTMHQLLPILAEACLWAGRIDEAAEVGVQMRELSQRIDHRLGKAWADGCDSLVRWKRGDAAGAVDQMLQAADDLESIPMIWPATRLRRQLAGRLHELGRTEEGLEQLRHVHSVCASVRAGLELEKTRAMFREMERRPPSVSTSDGPLGLTDAALKVALPVAEGMSNGQIAKKLRCSVRTVSTHLSNIYGKLDIGGAGARMRLGNLVRDEGLLE
jgi:ATP/maltotriose-dependent transcriptional regulator MalT